MIAQKVSIIICTYEPEPKAYTRLLAALDSVEPPLNWHHDITIIDNNSPTPIATRPETVAFVAAHPTTRVIHESTLGLSAARRRGIEETDGAWILFFDDDNDPTPSYVARACTLATEFPNVGAWGAGTVNVEFLEPLQDPFVDRYLHLLHHLHREYLEFASLRTGWLRCYPAGMGMMLRRDIAEQYLARQTSGELSATDRKGRSLTSAGDVQIVFTGIQMGYAAGLDPALQMQHMIGPRKATFAYLTQIAWGNGVSYAKAYQECYGQPVPGFYLPTSRQINQALYSRFYKALRYRQRRNLIMELASYIGQTEGNFLAADKPLPTVLAYVKKRIGLGA
jgi:glycosyltransferase involved in cell wall biosynthesis